MSNRVNFYQAAPAAMTIIFAQEKNLAKQFSQHPALNTTIWELLKLRISQINQCAYCLDMHAKNAIKSGESTARIIALSAWRDSPLFTETERCALQWSELLTADFAASDDAYQAVQKHFNDPEIVDLTIAINAINSWNRIARTFQPVVGEYKA